MASDRLETGVVRCGDDWPGVFIRGDDAFGFAMALRVRHTADPQFLTDPQIDRLAELLLSCSVQLNPEVTEVKRAN